MSANDEDRVDVDALLADNGAEQRNRETDSDERDPSRDQPRSDENDQEDVWKNDKEDEGSEDNPVFEPEQRSDETSPVQYKHPEKKPALTGDDIAGHYVQPTTAFEANKGSALPVEQRDASGNVVGVDAEGNLTKNTEITGYHKLTGDEISWMNTVKQAETDLAALALNVRELGPDVDRRLWAMARTHFQTGFMLLNRSIAKPEDPFDDRA